MRNESIVTAPDHTGRRSFAAHGWRRAVVALVASALCAGLGAFLCWHYPIAPGAVLAAFVLWSVVVFVRPTSWLVVVPALIPLLGFAPWTGWLTFEELDILVLGAAAGGYARMARAGRESDRTSDANPDSDLAAGLSIIPLALVALFAVSIGGALYRGVADAGGLQWGWFEGYYESLNSLRVAKGFALALLLAPLLVSEMRRADARAMGLLATGVALGSAGVAIAVLWERAAFPGILDFSSDYRTTGPFWEMHVGGATLDGILALTVPFAVRDLLCARSLQRTVVAAILVASLTYTCLTTFSRGVYVMLPIELALLVALVVAQSKAASPIGFSGFTKAVALSIVALFAFHLTFRAGGYRTLAAILGALAVSIPLTGAARHATTKQSVYGIGGGVIVGTVGVIVANAIPKGEYIVYGAAFACCVALALRRGRPDGVHFSSTQLAAFVWLLIAAAEVAREWGGDSALGDATIVIGVLLALFVVGSRLSTPLWPASVRTQGAIIGSAALLAGIVAVFSGGAYMSGRFATSATDLADRIAHWSEGIGFLHGPGDWALGKGMGRYPASYFFAARDSKFPGSYRLGSEDGIRHLVLSGPTYSISFGDAFRVSQRVPARQGAYTVSVEARVTQDVTLHVEICEKHLLYSEGCAISRVTVKASGREWQKLVLPLDGSALTGGPWYAPRLAFFSLTLETSSRLIEIRSVAVIGPDGRDLIANGDFGNGMARWFFTSDRYHLPWHIKNLALNVLFDQGVVGLALFAALVVIGLWRLIVGRARGHPLAPFVAASLTGFLVVGAFDSLLDAPRAAFLFYLLLLVSLALRESVRSVAGTVAHPAARPRQA